jgi:hypothetical protein
MTGQLSPLAQGKAAGAPAAPYGSLLLKTGQTTQYNDELDDGYYEKGVALSYTVNTSGSQSGNANVILAHYAGGAGAISFNNSTKKIADSGSGLAMFKNNDVILTSSVANPGPFTVTTGNVAGEIVCSGATFTDETPAGAVTISKQESISNNTVLDNNTGLVWMRYPFVKMGSASTGKVPWTGKLYDAFAICAAANTASVGGYTDWRVPNMSELYSILDHEAPTAYPNTTAWPSLTSLVLWCSTTSPINAAYSFYYNYNTGSFDGLAKTTEATASVLLVRGG